MASCSVARHVRKGAHSCVECRKRKLRCSRSSETAQSCRRCEERFLECIPQILSAPSTSKPSRKTRDRISWLEDKVHNLTEAVQALQQPTAGTISDLSLEYSASDSEAGETDTCSDIAIPTQPSYLNALFNNSILNSTENDATGRSNPTSSQFSHTIRVALQSLVPSKGNVISLAETSSGWLSLLHDIFPIMTDIKSGYDILSRHDEVLRPTANPLTVASWLLIVAITAQHNAGPRHQITLRNKKPLNGPRYSRLVAESVERTIIVRDQLMISVEGIATMTLLVRLHLTHGNFVQAFLLLRRALAIAELLGLPWATPRCLLWQHICTAERFQNMLLGFPSVTQHYGLGQLEPVLVDGKIVPPNFLLRLSSLALDINGPSDLRNHSTSLSEIQSAITKRDRDLKDLINQMPDNWWSDEATLSLSDRLIKHIYHYMTLRLHLPLLLRQDVSERGLQSRAACIDACRALLQGYIDVYPLILEGYFIQRILDLQIFTGAIVLLLADHSCGVHNHDKGATTDMPSVSMKLIANVVQAIEHHSENPRSDIAEQTLGAIQTLTELLGTDDSDALQGDTVLHVPLLGKLHVRRKTESEASIDFDPSIPDFDMAGMDIDQVATSNFNWSIEQAYDLLFYTATQS
ncbi:hypothetical protein PFICI_14956 [Pestalotiopsis fici W106-1]|uniref:Zn(2)-C6 fungal-type domain-containing protein n=1 Tax=Pestalotiopsis fici (strain W106-1 / CGMCC3.15140) TaxID=1229662 RepID=W3WKL1_PESFW|nr:uncharacterized protein PFICI_14956 [Pestalotiopsis fici W106-1]ETS73351.1 hypothetical protein PFICI_14956 [Pestalotiopsis fici W106-1]